MHNDNPNQILTTEQAAEYMQVSAATLTTWRCRGGGPPFLNVGSRTVRYRRTDLDEWMSATLRHSTSEIV